MRGTGSSWIGVHAALKDVPRGPKAGPCMLQFSTCSCYLQSLCERVHRRSHSTRQTPAAGVVRLPIRRTCHRRRPEQRTRTRHFIAPTQTLLTRTRRLNQRPWYGRCSPRCTDHMSATRAPTVEDSPVLTAADWKMGQRGGIVVDAQWKRPPDGRRRYPGKADSMLRLRSNRGSETDFGT